MRVLHFVPDIGVSNGIISVVLNYAKAMPSDIKFDVIYLMDNPKDRSSEVKALGGNVYKLGNGPIDVLKLKFYGFFKLHKGEWDVLHIHIPYFSAFVVPAAKMAGIKKICCHCHSTLFSLNPRNLIINKVLNIPTNFIVHKKFACGKEAGDYWYKKNYTVLKNAVDCLDFRFDKSVREMVRHRMELSGELVIGHIGRTDIAQKNHKFLFEIFSCVKSSVPKSKLMLIGGEKNDKLLEICKELGIENDVLFLGSRNDVSELLQAVDVFAFPSTNEGLPVSVVEAQAAGLPVIMSDAVTQEVIITEGVLRLPLSLPAEKWANEIITSSKIKREDTYRLMVKSGWDIHDNANKLIDFYRG